MLNIRPYSNNDWSQHEVPSFHTNTTSTNSTLTHIEEYIVFPSKKFTFYHSFSRLETEGYVQKLSTEGNEEK